MDYNKALYRRNNAGQPTVWYARVNNSAYCLELYYGILGKTISSEIIHTKRTLEDELKSRVNTKRKSGYMLLADVADSNTLPVEETQVIAYLDTYLPYDRQSHTGAMLHMLAKLYDNKNNKIFNKQSSYIVQPKINGLRCGIGAKNNEGDLFKPIALTFQSREGNYWDSLGDLEEYLLKVLPIDLLNLMINEDYILDGEVYLYGHAVNEINHLVKDPKDPKNKLLQFWCYDIAVANMTQNARLSTLDKHIGYCAINLNKEGSHSNNTERLVRVPDYLCTSDSSARSLRNKFIKLGFEGIVGRNPNDEYQFGKRNSAMWKFKAMTDGKFTIVDIVPEDEKRDLPLLVLKNDINNATFKASVNGSFDYQRSVIANKDKYMYRKALVEYGERSGVEQVPFHIKTVIILED